MWLVPSGAERSLLWNVKLSLAKGVRHIYKLGRGFKHFLFSLLVGEDSHFDDHIFQMG